MYLEAYTSILGVPRARLEEAWSIKIEEAPRELVESEIEPILERARHEDIAMLVVGDPFGATTHCDLLARARELGVDRVFCLTFETHFFASHGFDPIEGTPVDPKVYEQLLRSYDVGVAEFLDLERVKPNTLGNTRMLVVLK